MGTTTAWRHVHVVTRLLAAQATEPGAEAVLYPQGQVGVRGSRRHVARTVTAENHSESEKALIDLWRASAGPPCTAEFENGGWQAVRNTARMTAMTVDPHLCIEVPAEFDDSESESQVHPMARKMFFGSTNAEVFRKAQLWAEEQNVHLLDAAWDEMLDEDHPYVLTIYFSFEFEDVDESPRKIPQVS